MRAVLDPNVLIAAALSRDGAPALLLKRWLAGDFELVVSDHLVAELERALAYPKLRARVPVEAAVQLVSLLRGAATRLADDAAAPRVSSDLGDDYLVALARTARAMLVSGDHHLLDLAARLPVCAPREFLESLD